MSGQVANVYKQGVLAARLERVGDDIKFSYLPDYLVAGLPEVATTLPLTSEPVLTSGGSAPAFFAGLLPEGRRLAAVASRLKISRDNDLGLLLEIGADLIGDTQVLPIGADPLAERPPVLLPGDLAGVDFVVLREQVFGSKASGLPGVQDKISSRMLNVPAKMADTDFILKLNPADMPLVVENEAFFLALAAKCGIATAPFELLTDSHGAHALRLQRFDRHGRGAGKSRLAAEDGCQVLGRYPVAKYELEYIDVAKALIALCPARGVAGYELFKQLVFAWLTGNGDVHAKNLSVLQTTAGEWRVAPAYDLLCTVFYDNDTSMALPLFGKKTGWSRQLMLAAAAEMYVPQKAAEKVIDRQLKVLAYLPAQIRAGVLPYESNPIRKTANQLEHRAEMIKS